jgi:hypothetical protein
MKRISLHPRPIKPGLKCIRTRSQVHPNMHIRAPLSVDNSRRVHESERFARPALRGIEFKIHAMTRGASNILKNNYLAESPSSRCIRTQTSIHAAHGYPRPRGASFFSANNYVAE